MLGSDLRWLAGVAELADFKEAKLSLWADGEYTFAGCQATHNAGLRVTPGPTTFNASVLGRQFQSIVKAFPLDADVKLTLNGPRLVLEASGQVLRLAAEVERPRVVQLPKMEVGLRLDAATLKTEVELASDFVGEHNPVFKAIKLINLSNSIGIMAADGTAGGLLITSLSTAANPMHDTHPELLAYPADVLLGLKLVGEGEISLGIAQGRLGMTSGLAAYQCSQMEGRWPDIATRFSQYNDFKPPVKLDGHALNTVVDVAKELKASGIKATASERGVVLATLNTEWGEYADLASADPGNWEVSYSLRHFARAAQLGDEIAMWVPNSPTHPAKLTSGWRTYWIASMQR